MSPSVLDATGVVGVALYLIVLDWNVLVVVGNE